MWVEGLVNVKLGYVENFRKRSRFISTTQFEDLLFENYKEVGAFFINQKKNQFELRSIAAGLLEMYDQHLSIFKWANCFSAD